MSQNKFRMTLSERRQICNRRKSPRSFWIHDEIWFDPRNFFYSPGTSSTDFKKKNQCLKNQLLASEKRRDFERKRRSQKHYLWPSFIVRTEDCKRERMWSAIHLQTMDISCVCSSRHKPLVFSWLAFHFNRSFTFIDARRKWFCHC